MQQYNASGVIVPDPARRGPIFNTSTSSMSDKLRILQRQPRRITITLSHSVHEALTLRSDEEGRSVSNLCAFLLEEALLDRRSQAVEGMPGYKLMHNGHSLPNELPRRM
jgi:hypothetical protein